MEPNHSPEFVDHFTRPRNVGALNRRSRRVGTATVRVSECGDVMRLQIDVDPRGRISRAMFKTFGCSAAIAAGSVTTEWLRGRNVQEAESFSGDYVTERLSLPPEKQHGSRLAEDAVRQAVADWKHTRRRGHPA
jgi:NifU-like protein involved in Fe-S cluster formation